MEYINANGYGIAKKMLTLTHKCVCFRRQREKIHAHHRSRSSINSNSIHFERIIDAEVVEIDLWKGTFLYEQRKCWKRNGIRSPLFFSSTYKTIGQAESSGEFRFRTEMFAGPWHKAVLSLLLIWKWNRLVPWRKEETSATMFRNYARDQ